MRALNEPRTSVSGRATIDAEASSGMETNPMEWLLTWVRRVSQEFSENEAGAPAH